MALTAEVLFVNPDYLKRVTQLNGGVEEAGHGSRHHFGPGQYFQQYLGTDLLNKLKADIRDALDGVYETLVDDYVRKATAWWSMVEMLPNLYEARQRGPRIRTAENTAAIGPDDLHCESRTHDRTRTTPRAREYLCANLTSVPGIQFEHAAGYAPTMTAYYQNGISSRRSRPNRPDPPASSSNDPQGQRTRPPCVVKKGR